jgi:predicted ATPase with chaperone activity
MTKEDFYKVWKDSSREDILNQYYYDRKELQERLNKVQDRLEEQERYFKKMSEVLLDRIEFYEDVDNDKTCWIEENQREKEKMLDKIDKAIDYINNHQLVFQDATKNEIQDWFDMFYKELLDILREGEENE